MLAHATLSSRLPVSRALRCCLPHLVCLPTCLCCVCRSACPPPNCSTMYDPNADPEILKLDTDLCLFGDEKFRPFALKVGTHPPRANKT